MSNTDAVIANAYVDLHFFVKGYLSRIREVAPKGRAKPFMACSISVPLPAVEGQKRRYTNYDVRAYGAKAAQQLKNLAKNASSARVEVCANLGDVYVHEYTQTRGAQTGQQAYILKGRMLLLKDVMIDGVPFDLDVKEAA